MRRAAIVSPVRTPVGKFGGALKSVAVEELGSLVVNEVIKRAGIDPAVIDDVIFAQSYANSETPCVGRWIALQAGLPEQVPGMQLDRRCGGGLQAIATGSMMIQSGAADVVVVGGVESMSNIEYYSTNMRWGARSGSVSFYDRLDRGRERSQPVGRYGVISGMIETAENLAKKYDISRESSDLFALSSHEKAQRAWEEGRFDNEVVPVLVPQRKGDALLIDRDEGIRPNISIDDLANLRPLMKGGTVTAGNSSQQNDAASACLIVAEDKLNEYGLEPDAFLVDWTAVGCDASIMGIGPAPAINKLRERTGIDLDSIDLIEINEAFACQVLAVLKELEYGDISRVNVNGSGISLGHPIGATGVRVMTTMLNELSRIKGKYALESMCIGGGQGMAALFERP